MGCILKHDKTYEMWYALGMEVGNDHVDCQQSQGEPL